MSARLAACARLYRRAATSTIVLGVNVRIIERKPSLILMCGTALLPVVVGGCASPGHSAPGNLQRADQARFERVRADRMLRDGRFDEAIRAYLSLLEEVSDDTADPATIHLHLSKAYWARAGRVAEQDATAETLAADQQRAIESARTAYSALRDSVEESKRDLLGRAGRTLGGYLHAQDRLDEAIDVFRSVLTTSDTNDVGRLRTLYELGNACLDRSRRRSDRAGGNDDSPDDLISALRYLDEAREIARRVEDCPPELLASICNSLGLIHNVQLQPALAVERFAQAESLCREYGLTAIHADVLQNLVLALVETGRYTEARERCKQLEELPATASDPRAMVALGLALLKLGDLPQAQEQFDLARHIVLQDRDSGTDPDFMAQLACNAATVAQAMGAFDEAERYLKDAKRGAEAGTVDPRTVAVIQANLGRMYLTIERLDEAQTQLDEVLETLIRLQGAQHPDTLLVRLDLANLARARGYLVEAEEQGEAALRGLASALGNDHPQTAAARLELATLYRDDRRCPEAVALANQALAALDVRLGENHKLAVLACLKAALIAADCREEGTEDSEFRRLQEEAGRRFAHLRDTLGSKNIEVLRAMVYFAEVSARTPAAHATALERFREAEEGFLAFYTDGARSMAALRLKQGRLLARMGRLDEAMRVCDRALRLMNRDLHQQPIHAELLAVLGDIHESAGRHDQAIERWREALGILTAAYGPDHPRVLKFREQRVP